MLGKFFECEADKSIMKKYIKQLVKMEYIQQRK